jgi:hypothetical protein
MFCSNCGAKNSKKQNYCRFCGLNLQEAAKSLTSQLVFGEDSNLLKTLSKVKRTVDFASTALVGVLIVGIIAYLSFAPAFGKDLLKISLGLFLLLQTGEGVIGYFQRKERSKSKSKKFESDETEHFKAKETAKLLEERPFEPVASVAENSTELFPMEKKTRKFK